MDALSAPTAYREITARGLGRWARFLRIFLIAFGGGLALVLACLIVIDPYDSGRFPSPMPSGVNDETPASAVVSRGRDPRFEAAIIGNSHVALLDPHRLGSATGLPFVQLELPGSGPLEQATVLRYFLRYHTSAKALVIGIDPRTCLEDDSWLRLAHPFPFWLYGSTPEYLARAMSTRSTGRALSRIGVALGMQAPTDPAGYSDYERGASPAAAPLPVARDPVDLSSSLLTGARFSGLDALETAIGSVPETTMIVFLFPPQFISALPESGSESWRELKTCKYEVAQRAGRRGNWRYLDFLVDSPDTRDPRNFLDAEHYRAPLARRMEAAIADVLRPAQIQTIGAGDH